MIFALMESVQFNKCRSCAYLEPVHHYCDKYLRGVETAVYLCPSFHKQAIDNGVMFDGVLSWQKRKGDRKMKAILVIDMPNDCWECPMHIDGLDDENEEIMVCNAKSRESHYGEKPSWCPLKPMPTKKKPLFDPDHCEIEKEIKIVHEIIGYNRCIDEIMGETDDETVKSA